MRMAFGLDNRGVRQPENLSGKYPSRRSLKAFQTFRLGIAFFSRGRFPLSSGYQMRPAASNSFIVSLLYRHPIGGDGKPFHSYIMLGRGCGLVISPRE